MAYLFRTMDNPWSTYTRGGPIAIPTEESAAIHEGIIGKMMAANWDALKNCGAPPESSS